MEKIRVFHHLVMCFMCLGFNFGMCSESDALIKTYVSSSLPSDDLVDSSTFKVVPSISDESKWFTLVMGSEVPVMVMFKATWCAPCRVMNPILDQLNSDYRRRFKFYTVDVDDVPDIPTRYHVAALPTIIVFKYGEEMATLIGPQSQDRLLEIVKQYV